MVMGGSCLLGWSAIAMGLGGLWRGGGGWSASSGARGSLVPMSGRRPLYAADPGGHVGVTSLVGVAR